MIQKSSLPENPQTVSKALKADKHRDGAFANALGFCP